MRRGTGREGTAVAKVSVLACGTKRGRITGRRTLVSPHFSHRTILIINVYLPYLSERPRNEVRFDTTLPLKLFGDGVVPRTRVA